MKSIVGLLLITVVGFLFWYSFSLGLFKPVEIYQDKVGPMKVIYKEHVGPYHEVQASLIEVERWAKTKGVDCTKTFGEYLDNPQIVEHARLRSNVGCVLSEFPSEFPSDFKIKEFPAKEYVVANFTGSPALGPYKVYNKVSDYFEAQRLPFPAIVIEIYSLIQGHELKTQYLFEYGAHPQ